MQKITLNGTLLFLDFALADFQYCIVLKAIYTIKFYFSSTRVITTLFLQYL